MLPDHVHTWCVCTTLVVCAMHTWSSSTEPGRSEPDWIHKGISILELDDGAVPQGTALIYKAVVVRKASEDIWVGRRG